MNGTDQGGSQQSTSDRANHERQERMYRARNVFAIVLGAAGSAGMYYSQWLLVTLRVESDFALTLAGISLWPSSMAMLIAAVLLLPPGNTRIYVRAAFLILVAVAVLTHVFVIDYPFPGQMAWWD